VVLRVHSLHFEDYLAQLRELRPDMGHVLVLHFAQSFFVPTSKGGQSVDAPGKHFEKNEDEHLDEVCLNLEVKVTADELGLRVGVTSSFEGSAALQDENVPFTVNVHL